MFKKFQIPENFKYVQHKRIHGGGYQQHYQQKC